MASFLHIRSGCYHLLVEAGKVLEVLDHEKIEGHFTETHNCFLWRGASLYVADMNNIFSNVSEIPSHAGLVFQTDDSVEPIILTFDQVIGLIQANESQFLSLPSLVKTSLFLIKALPDTTSGQMLLHVDIAKLLHESNASSHHNAS